MSVSSAPGRSLQVAGDRRPGGWASGVDGERRYRRVVFTGVLPLVLGTVNFIEGLAAIGNAHFFVANAHYIADASTRQGGAVWNEWPAADGRERNRLYRRYMSALAEEPPVADGLKSVVHRELRGGA